MSSGDLIPVFGQVRDALPLDGIDLCLELLRLRLPTQCQSGVHYGVTGRFEVN